MMPADSAACLTMPIIWKSAANAEFPWIALVDGRVLVIRVNDFPAEPLYTLFIDDTPAAHLEEWPPAWHR